MAKLGILCLLVHTTLLLGLNPASIDASSRPPRPPPVERPPRPPPLRGRSPSHRRTPTRKPPAPRPPRPPPSPPRRKPSPPPPRQSLTDSRGAAAAEEALLGRVQGGGCPDAAAVLDAHNTYRAWHGAAALQWDEDLAEEAQEFAQELARGGCLIRHDKDAYEEFGENVYGTGGFPAPDRSCKVAADVWYGEVLRYDFNSRNPAADALARDVLHFTAMVWGATTRVGCGLGYNDAMPIKVLPGMYGGCKVVVCRYNPMGNQPSNAAFSVNVLPRE